MSSHLAASGDALILSLGNTRSDDEVDHCASSPSESRLTFDSNAWGVWVQDADGRVVKQDVDDIHDPESYLHDRWCEQFSDEDDQDLAPAVDDGSGLGEWPFRLLHVGSMTSFERRGDSYGSVSNPRYNVLSYTWGNYQDITCTQPALEVHGIDWPIPRINKAHFTSTSFHHVLRMVAQGLKQQCDWVWVDIACIPQRHDGESLESQRLRDQEIGRQAKIFRGAQESFAWFSSLQIPTPDPKYMCGKSSLDVHTLLELQREVLLLSRETREPEDDITRAVAMCLDLEIYVGLFFPFVNTIFRHPWFKSLWTLQEMVVCDGMYLLTDTGFIPCISEPTSSHLTMRSFGEAFAILARSVSFNNANTFRPELITAVRERATHYQPCRDPETLAELAVYAMTTSLAVHRRMDLLCEQSSLQGLDSIGRHGKNAFGHSAYSISNRRRTLLPEDRIYGIQQVYNISCSPLSTTVADPKARLAALEDEFGLKLVAQDPLFSQLFVHGSFSPSNSGKQEGKIATAATQPEVPRRSWLITQNCRVDTFWLRFYKETCSQDYRNFVQFNRYDFFGIDSSRSDQGKDLRLRFTGQAWHLEHFLVASGTNPDKIVRGRFFSGNPVVHRDPERYNGLMLDHHICWKALGRTLDYFTSHEEMVKAVQALNILYDCRSTDDIGEPNLGAISKRPAICVALLGSAQKKNWPESSHCGLVLAPLEATDPDDTERSASTMDWERIGLMRWRESHQKNAEMFVHLPPSHDFSCLIR
ncbi:HET domain-containing protein [Microdochium nivale]|nr:HET domain-containing protein [Microdochium nivale]